MASLPIPTRDVPPDLKCPICLDISIDPVVPAITSTDEKIEKVCKHFLCRTCEHINKEFALEHRRIDEINCPICLQNYSSVLSDEGTAEKVKNFVHENPYSFDNKSYDELFKEREASIPVAIQIMDAIKKEKLDEIEKIAAKIENPKEKSKILFEIALKQLNKANIEAAKILLNLIPNENHQFILITLILQSIFQKDSSNHRKPLLDTIIEIEQYIETLPNKPLKANSLHSLIAILQNFLLTSGSALDKEDKENLIQKILVLIDLANSLSPAIESVADCISLTFKANLYFSVGNLEKAQKYFTELKMRIKDIPEGLEKYLILSTSIVLSNKDFSLEFLEEIANEIRKLKLTAELKDTFFHIIFSIFVRTGSLEKIEDLAREFSENGSSLENMKKALQDNIDFSPFLKKPSAIKMNFYSPFDDMVSQTNITSTPPRIFALFAVAIIFINNDKIEDGLRILNEINQTDDTSSITFQDSTISDLKDEIRQTSESLYKKMFYRKNTSICAKIIEYKLINEEDVKRLQMEAIEENTPVEEEVLSERRRRNLCNKIFSVFLYPIAVTVISVLIKRMYFDK